MAKSALERLWNNPTETTADDLRRMYGDCWSCHDAGCERSGVRPGIATERAVWVDEDGRVSEDIYRVCSDCLRAANGGPGYYRDGPAEPKARTCYGCGRDLDPHAGLSVVYCGQCGEAA